MEFRPCIDIHDGQVKQIVGGTLRDSKLSVKENFVSEVDAPFYARMYKDRGISGGHVIILNGSGTPGFDKSRSQAKVALRQYPGGLQLGGGVNPENAEEYLEAGASHVIVTSYVFRNGEIDAAALERMVNAVGKEHLVLDLSCRRLGDKYMIVTDRWQKFTDVELDIRILEELSLSCSEYLIHAVDVEGKASGIETGLVELLGEWKRLPVTYAGGVHSYEDMELVKALGQGHVNITIGSALDIFGGSMKLEDVVEYCKK